MIIGHNQLLEDFKRLVKLGRLAHVYVFFGETEVGKFYFSKHLANLLENGEMDLVPRPLQDALILAGSTSIADMRQIKKFLWQKPAVSSKRLVVLNDAHNLTAQAQNAILKITEEPPEHSLIILVTSQPNNLLPALSSRMQKIYFGRLSDNEMEKVIKKDGGSAKDLTKLVQASLGRPGRAMRLLADPVTKEAEFYANNFLKYQGAARSRMIKELVDAQKDKPELLDLFFEAYVFQLRKDRVKNLETLKSTLHRLFLIKSYNTNKRLQLEAI